MPGTLWFIYDDAAAHDPKTPAYHNQTGDPVADGYGYKADSLKELAALINVPSDELTTTVAQWNECVANGKDIFYFRPDHTLTPISTAPFYAVKCEPELLNTDGGPRRDEMARIIDLDGEPIENLYSAGEFGSVWCHDYQGGGNLGECVAWGRLAARSCLGVTADPASFAAPNEAEIAWTTLYEATPNPDNKNPEGVVLAAKKELEAPVRADATATDKATSYADGVFESTSYGMNGDIAVSVTVSGGKISAVGIGSHAETLGYGGKAIEQLPGIIIEANGVNVDCISGATTTSLAIMDAVAGVLEKA
jgi:uncharacterized protein with FMN-binding domain